MKIQLPKKCHFIGIGGIGMSGLAQILLKHYVNVSGSDISSNANTQKLAQSGAKIFQSHSAENITHDAVVVYSSDIKKENPEYQAAINQKCPLWHRSDLLCCLMGQSKVLAVSGTHGKTTTTSLLTCVLLKANLDPTYAIGGVVAQLNSNAGYGKGEYFVAEADESDGTFLKYHPYGAIVTNIDNDHMNFFETEEKLINAFKTFLNQVSSAQHCFWCYDDLHLRSLNMPGFSYGFHPNSNLVISNFQQNEWCIIFDLSFKGKNYKEITLQLTGKHNALNGASVFGLALQLGIPEATIRDVFVNFKGVGRRCEKKWDKNDILFLDDYAHHPTEIKATLQAIRNAVKKKRIICIYQPHRYSRITHCLGFFGGVFNEADDVIITDLYASGETPIPGVSHEKVIEEVLQNGKSCRYVSRQKLAETLKQEIKPFDVVVSLGAGDITKLADEVSKK